MAQERLQKLIAAAGICSRREAERRIEAGRVSLNGQRASLGTKADPGQDRIEVDGHPLRIRQQRTYLLLNKPVGYVCTLKDPQGRPLVTDLVKKEGERLFPVGRLDLNTEGLLLMTNDGEFSQRMLHPRHQMDKTYLVRVRGHLDATHIARLEAGITLEDGLTAPARVQNVRRSGSSTWFELLLREGRNRQVRRMCEALGFTVSRLKRIRFGFLDLEGVPVGSYRSLEPREVRRLQDG